MGMSKRSSRGFTLIAALLLLVLLSALAVGVMFLVTNEGHMSSNEQEDNLAYYGAQSGIEKLTADLSLLYQTSMNRAFRTPRAVHALRVEPGRTRARSHPSPQAPDARLA